MAKKTIDDSNLDYLVSKAKAAFWPKADVVQISIDASPTANSTNLVTSGGVHSSVSSKQDALVSGTNIKTVNNESLLGSGNITINADTSDCELLANKVTSISSSSTDTQYPSAKCVYDNLALKQNLLYANELVGSMYRNNVSGTGTISINGTSGEFPTVSSAGTYTVVTSMSSSTQSYGLNVNFGGNTYSLTTINGKIYDSRTVAIDSNKTWSASVNGSVASGTIIDVKLYKSSPIISNVEVTANKVTSLSSSSNDNQYPSAKAVYDIIGDVETLINAL